MAKSKRFGNVGYRVRIFLRGRIWQAAYYEDGRERLISLRTTDEAEAAELGRKRAEDLKQNGGADLGKQILYVVQRRHNGPIKVGISSHVKLRLRSLQSSSPEKLTIIKIFTLRQVERAIHAYLADYRLEGEWFDPAAFDLLRRFLERPARYPRGSLLR